MGLNILKSKRVDNTIRHFYIVAFIILLITLLLTLHFINSGIDSQNRYIDYLVLLDLYERVTSEYQNSFVEYWIYNDNTAIDKHQVYNYKDFRKNIYAEFYELGLTQEEKKIIKEIEEICCEMRLIEANVIDRSYEIPIVSDELLNNDTTIYIELSRLHNQKVDQLRDTIKSRMTDEVSQKIKYINKGFMFMSLAAFFVPILLYINNYKVKKLNQIIQAEKELHAATIRNINDGIIVVDLHGIIIHFNPAAENITGYTSMQATGNNITEIVKIDGNNDKISNCKYNDYKTTMACPIAGNSGNHLKLITASGDKKIITLTCSKISNSKKIKRIVFTIRDETRKVKTQEKNEQVKRLESLGLIAGGIAHDFNNTLTVIVGNVGLAKLYQYQGKNELLLNCLLEIEKETNRAQYITKEIITFSKGGIPIKKVENLYSILKAAAESILKNTKIKYSIRAPVEELKMEADYGQMLQAIKNIVKNSLESMSEQGEITIELRKASKNGSAFAEIRIIDNGKGVSEENLDKIFDPYYTTKDAAQGLGLPTAYSIIKNHNGSIDVESKPGFTLFRILLPITVEVEKEKKHSQKVTCIKSILLMDDQEKILSIAKTYLGEHGYEIDIVTNGEDAIKKYREKYSHGAPYDLVILDLLVVRGMGGKETMIQLLQLNPDVKGIVASGYSSDSVMGDYKKYGFLDILPKPYTPQQLLSKIKEFEY